MSGLLFDVPVWRGFSDVCPRLLDTFGVSNFCKEEFPLKKALILAVCALPYLSNAADSDATLNPPPIIGKWTWTRSTNNCTEVYDFRADGTMYATSGGEIATATYVVSGHKDSNGFYEMRVKPLTTNGAQDCSDRAPGGEQNPYTVYIIFHPTQPLHLVCQTPELDQCFGPLEKIE